MRSPTRGRFEGVAQILRFNWPMYVAAAIVLALGAAAIFLIPLHDLLRVAASAALALAGFWLLVSLAVSHYVYDRAGIYRGEWLSVALPQEPRRYANLHAGFDEFSLALAARFPSASARVLDFFDPGVMTEPSIARARKVETGQPRAECVNFRSLPLADGELDAAFLIFAAHELRDPESRVALLRELARVLKPTGRVVIVEHLRDLPNFLAFGPGFLHFHSRVQWLRDFAAAQLRVANEFSLTAFVRAFVLEKT
jgi:SAM-dependent methyltransferase